MLYATFQKKVKKKLVWLFYFSLSLQRKSNELVMKVTLEQLNEIKRVYQTCGLNSVHAYIKRHEISCDSHVYEFGFGQKASENKWKFIENAKGQENVLRFHYYSVLKKCRRNGLTFNLIRAIEFVF